MWRESLRASTFIFKYEQLKYFLKLNGAAIVCYIAAYKIYRTYEKLRFCGATQSRKFQFCSQATSFVKFRTNFVKFS